MTTTRREDRTMTDPTERTPEDRPHRTRRHRAPTLVELVTALGEVTR